MVIDCSAAAVTAIVTAFDVIPFEAAVMLLDPTDCPLAKPTASIFTTVESELVHEAVVLRSCVLPSLNVPVAVNWTVVPFAIDDLPALIVMDCSEAAVTDNVTVLDVIPFFAAVMLLDPTATPVARPFASIVTTAGLELVHAAVSLKS